MTTTGLPPTEPAKTTRPAAAARTALPGAARRSTPRWPASHSWVGGWDVLERKQWNAQQLAGWFTIVIKVDGDSLEATLNGAPLFKRTIPGIGAGGNFGLLMGGGKARFRHLRVFEPD